MILSDRDIKERLAYDLRLAAALYVATAGGEALDPKQFHNKAYRDRMFTPLEGGGPFEIPPRGFALGASLECLGVPPDLIARCVGKSTYHRCGVIVSVTPREPAWEGVLTIEIQLVSYADKGGKYQNQTGVTFARVL